MPGIPPRLLPMQVTWSQPGTTTDAYGNETTSWATKTDTTIAARLEQTTGSEVEGQTGAAAVGGWVLFTNELGIKATHRITWNGVTFEVDGPPSVVYDATSPHHLEARLLVVEAA